MDTRTVETVDVAGLVEEGLLDIDVVFWGVEWAKEYYIASYAISADNGDEVAFVGVWLYSATRHGITAYRWRCIDERDVCVEGSITLSRADAVEAGAAHARDMASRHITHDFIRQIAESGYFGDTTPYAIWCVCEEASRHTCGYLVLPAGKVPDHPVTRYYRTTKPQDAERCVVIPANCHDIAAAANALLRAINNINCKEVK